MRRHLTIYLIPYSLHLQVRETTVRDTSALFGYSSIGRQSGKEAVGQTRLSKGTTSGNIGGPFVYPTYLAYLACLPTYLRQLL